jgi:hypothetical protein
MGSPNPTLDQHSSDKSSLSDDWTAALSVVTHAPVDLGIEAGFETPFGLRLSGVYGYVPSAYLNVITNSLVSANALSAESELLLKEGFESGHSVRLQVGLRPFKSFGGYLDGGYSHIGLSGSFDASDANVDLVGGYHVTSSLDLWFLELGYQGIIADRLLIAGGFGLMRIFNAKTNATPNGSATAVPRSLDQSVTGDVDNALEKYGFIPTLSLRVGFDFI